MAKISAVMIERRRYQSQFDLLHTSTFGDDEFSSTVALKTLELLDADTLKACRDKGQWLRHRLLALMRKYEGTLADVRGDGLLLGIELQKRSSASSFVLRFLSNSGLLGFLVAGYLLRIHDIRVAPTLSDRLTLRVQPSALIRFEQLDRFVHAMEDVCARLHDEDVVGLTRFLHHADTTDYDVPTISNPDQKFFTYAPISAPEEQPSDDWEPVARVAWLFHLVDESDLIHLEPAFHEFSSRARNAYLNRFASFAEPVLMSSIDVRSRIGDCVRVYPLLLPVTSSRLRRLFQARRHLQLRDLVQRGVDAAEALGCDIVSLGQFTSIVTRNARNVATASMGIASGNSYTASLVVQAVRAKLDESQIDPSRMSLAIVGAGGNIGRACVQLMAPEFGQTILLGSGKTTSQSRLRRLARQFGAHATSDISQLETANVVVCATNSVDLPLGPSNFAPHAIVCDVSIPQTLQRCTGTRRPDLTLIQGGICRLPYGEDLKIPGFPLPAGFTYGCMAEGILLGFEKQRDTSFTGPVSLDKVRHIKELARKHGLEPCDAGTASAAAIGLSVT